MGYRSEVVLIFNNCLLHRFLDVSAKCDETIYLVFKERTDWDKEFQVNDFSGSHHCIIWTRIKWYEECHKKIEYFVNRNGEYSRFIRIGEGQGDHEDYGNFAHDEVEIQVPPAEIVFL